MEWKSTLKMVESILQIVESTLKRVIQTTILWSGFHYLGVGSTPNEVVPNMTPKRVDFHSTAIIHVHFSFLSRVNHYLSLCRLT